MSPILEDASIDVTSFAVNFQMLVVKGVFVFSVLNYFSKQSERGISDIPAKLLPNDSKDDDI